jgi:hypothetical protein
MEIEYLLQILVLMEVLINVQLWRHVGMSFLMRTQRRKCL